MKKFIIFAALVFALSGCSNSLSVSPEEVSEAYGKDFSASVKAAFGENKAEITVLKNGMSISIIVKSPARYWGQRWV